MTTIESKEIRGITLRILYLLVAFSVVSTAGIMTSYFSLKNDNQLLGTQIEILKIQYKIIGERLEKIESKKDNQSLNDHSAVNAVSQKPSTYDKFIASTIGIQIR
jgi:hypothetical protein